MPDYVSQMSFFCGHSPECDTVESEAMFRLAVRNVDRYYAVVGVLEEWQKSLAVLEAFLPRYFKGARQLLKRPEYKEIRHLNANIYKPETDPAVKRRLERVLAREMDFYHYCRQRLRKQYELVEEEYG